MKITLVNEREFVVNSIFDDEDDCGFDAEGMWWERAHDVPNPDEPEWWESLDGRAAVRQGTPA